jgi:small subunit ribosomal protein S17
MAKKLKGVVVSDKMAKTVVVNVMSYSKHSLYGKYVKKNKRYKAHDEKKEYKVGDKVIIQETRPISKDKHWEVVGKI